MSQSNQSLFLFSGVETGNGEDSRVWRVPFSHLLVHFLPSAFSGMRVGDLADSDQARGRGLRTWGEIGDLGRGGGQ